MHGVKGLALRTAGNLLIALFWANFLVINIVAFSHAPKLSLLVLSGLEGVTAALYILRMRAREISRHVFDWALGIVGTVVVMLYRPTLAPDFTPGEVLTILGALIAILSLLSLNRSFGVVAAKREIKTSGMYRFVRHPAYASYCLMCLGYVLTNPSLYNAIILSITVVLLVLRVVREEALLARDAAYAAYQKRVPWRLIPLLY